MNESLGMYKALLEAQWKEKLLDRMYEIMGTAWLKKTLSEIEDRRNNK